MKTLTNTTGDDLLLKDKPIIKAGKTVELEDSVAAELLAKYPTQVVEGAIKSEAPVETKPKRKRKK